MPDAMVNSSLLGKCCWVILLVIRKWKLRAINSEKKTRKAPEWKQEEMQVPSR